METKVELLENNDKDKSYSIYNRILVIVMVIGMFFILSNIIDNKNVLIEKQNAERLEALSELYKFKREVVIKNSDIVSEFLRKKFSNLKEYRIMFIGNNTITVMVNEPIKKSDNKVGYSSVNIYELSTVIEPNKLEIQNIYGYSKNQIYYNSIDDSREHINTNIITKTFTDIGFNVATFFAKYIAHIEPEKVSTFFNNLHNIFIDIEREAIENPILLVNIGTVQSSNENLPVIKSLSSSMMKGASEIMPFVEKI